MYRSLLFVPGDSEKKIAKAMTVGADVVILDLEDAVADSRKAAARGIVREALRAGVARSDCSLFVRINPLGSPLCHEDLAAVMAGRPDGIVLPKAASADDTVRLSNRLDVLEAENGIGAGATRIIPVATEVPEALFTLGSYRDAGPRLAALTWGAEDLAAAVGALDNKDPDGRWSAPFELARSLCLFAASAAGVPAIDTLYADFRDSTGLAASSRRARRDGFAGKLAIHPDQVSVINSAFTPTAEEVARARRIVELFEANPGAGALSLDGRMLDMPHLVQARKTVALAERLTAS
ncbi:MAG: CoA ester lyase [Steroidobacteraceae bacterium]